MIGGHCLSLLVPPLSKVWQLNINNFSNDPIQLIYPGLLCVRTITAEGRKTILTLQTIFGKSIKS
jgi:hypothetical protein